MENNEQIMTLSELASYLKIAERTLLKMVHNNEIPAFKIASQWRFIKYIIDDWIFSKMNLSENLQNSKDPDFFSLSRLFTKDNVIFNINARSKKEALIELIAPLAEKKIIQHPDNYLEKLMHREGLLSTGLGNGIALPHIRNIKENPVGPYVVAGISKKGFDFDSLDGKLTHMIFLIVSSEEATHLRLMSKISELFVDSITQEQILDTDDISEFIKIVLKKEYEINYNINKIGENK